jgi:urease accessory protein
MRSEAPLVLRRTPDAVYVVGGAAGPIGGDVLSLRIEVGPGAALRLQTSAASVALPGGHGRESVLTVTASVAAGGRLEYLPEPTVAAAGARHRVEMRFRLAADASLVLRDELILGRYGEKGGSCRTRLRVDVDGAPLLRHELAVCGEDGTSLGPAVLSGHRAAGCLLRAGPGADAIPSELAAGCAPGVANPGAGRPADVAVMPLAGSAVLVTALADDAITLRERLTLPRRSTWMQA